MFAKLKQKLNVDSVAGGDRPEMTPDKYGSMVGDMAGGTYIRNFNFRHYINQLTKLIFDN